jgi:signal transduction histidine kinase/CheY-like chemotaxis protein
VNESAEAGRVPSAHAASAGSLALARRLLWWLVVPVGLLLAVLTARQASDLLAAAERAWLAEADQRVEALDDLARPAAEHVQDLRRLLEDRWHDAPEAGPRLAQALSARPGGDGWSLDEAPAAERERLGQLWWAPADGRPPDADWLRRGRMFTEAARIVHARQPGFEATWFAAADENASFGFPWVGTARMLATYGLDSLRALDGPRREAAERSLGALAADPTATVFWSTPAVSQLHGQLVLSHGADVIVDRRYVGEVSLDFRLSALEQLAVGWQREGTRVWITDQALNVLADPAQPLAPPPGSGQVDQRVVVALAERLVALGVEADSAALADWIARLGQDRSLLLPAGDWLLAAAGREGMPWLVVQVLPRSQLRAEVLPALLPNALLGLALLGVFVAGQWLIARWFVGPALAVLAYLRQLAADPRTPAPRLGERWAGWIEAVTDTFRRQRDTSAMLDEHREALRQSEKLSAMGSLLAGVAHELNNPLAIAMGRASLLDEKAQAGAAAAELAEDARRIREATERCGRIVRTFLNMARQRPPARRPVQLNDIVRAAADMLGYTLRSHGVQLELVLADNLPDVRADPDQLGQVVLNLMVNARQALESQAGTRLLVVASGIETARPGREPRVWLRVADNGPGVPDSLKPRLFEPFFTTKASGLGTGLGLSVSRGIVREHGGDLVLEQPRDTTGPAPGAAFRLSLPISGERAADEGDSQPAALPNAASVAGATADDGAAAPRVLVVDDEPEVAELLRELLESAGYDVATAESGAVALELLAEARFDAVISDIRMPDLDGPAFAARLKREHPALARRVLFVSGDTLSDAARDAIAALDAPTLDKPFASAEVLQALKRLLA